MKIKKLKLTNFAKFSDIEVVFNDQVTHLVGMNGAGKTTIGLTAIQAGLKGIAEKAKDGQLIGDRFRFIGPNKKSADIFLTIIDEAKGSAEINVHNRITEAGNSISFEAPEGYNIGGNWLNNLLSVAFLSAKNFTQLSTKEQALLLGIDVSSKDKEIAAKKAEITEVNRDIKNIGQLVKIEPAQKVSVSTLLADKKLIDDKNEEIKAANAEIDRITTGVVEFKARREQLMA
jgi:DNA repair exonuclease SbcCD ATPase subunit